MIVRRGSLLLAVSLLISACGGGGVAPPTPTPTPTPPPGPTGTVTGSVTVAASRVAPPPAGSFPTAPLRRAGGPAFVPNQLMVKFRAGASAGGVSALHGQVGSAVIGTIERLNVQVVRLQPGGSMQNAMAAYRSSPLVEYVEQDPYVYALATPNDSLYGSQWHYPQINLPSAWDTTRGGGVIVAVIDTGIRADHPDLSGMTVQGFDFADNDSNPTDPGCPTVDPTDYSHGTHVSGTIAARTNNSVGVAGVNWGGVAPTKLMALRILEEDIPANECGVGSNSNLAAAITYAADHGAKVINMSLGGPGGSITVDNAINYARARGLTLVAAAGNDFCGPVSYPASNANVIAVAATTTTNARAAYSSCGAQLDIAAPGGDGSGFVLSTTWRPSDGLFVYVGFQGTSMATPHVAGVVALMISRGWVGPATIQSRLEATATDLGSAGKDTQFGSGLVNAALAVGGGVSTSRLRTFSGVISGTTITRQSDIVEVTSNATFVITNAQTGTKTVFVWQDFNNNGVVDANDSFGQTPGVVINPGMTTSGVAVTVQRYTGPTLTVN